MTCVNYKQGKVIKENDEDKYLMYVELFSTDDPTELPTDATNIENFPPIYTPEKVKFLAGSYIYSTASGNVWLANEDGEFIKQ